MREDKIRITYETNIPDLDQYFRNLMSNRQKMETAAKYKVGQMVRLIKNQYAIMRALMLAYNKYDAQRYSESLSGSYVTVIGVEELEHNGTTGTYYTVESTDGLIWCFKESMLFED